MQLAQTNLVNATIVRDPEVTQTPNGTTKMKITAVVNHGRRDDEQADFYNVTVWGKQAETLLALRDSGALTKGARVVASGSLTHNKYQGRDGSEKLSLDLNATHVILVSPPKGYQAGGHEEDDLSQVPF